ncbi:MAG TPA: XF1762 family protein [Nocardioidaceae bacterium]|nr:XF1762 family protein [Nocardioidaceae bacterium]
MVTDRTGASVPARAASTADATSLAVVPVSFADACGFVELWHRHHAPPVGHKFSVGVADGAGMLRGVAIVGRPVARHLDDGLTLEVTRSATDGTPNVNSMLYGTVWRAAKALGYGRLVTYTQAAESGASLRAAGWQVVAERRARRGWWTPSRPRDDRGTDGIPRTLWEVAQ